MENVGTKLGQFPTRTRANSSPPSMLDVVRFFHKHPGKLFKTEDLPEELLSKSSKSDKTALDNCFHQGYILRGPKEGQEHYFYPHLSQVHSLKEKFNNSKDGLDCREQKLRIIQELIEEMSDTSDACNLDYEKESEDNFYEYESLVEANTQEEIEKQSEDISNEEQSSLEKNIQQQIQQYEQDLECLNSQMSAKKAVVEVLESLLKQNYEDSSSLKAGIEKQIQQCKQDIHNLELKVHEKKAVVEALNSVLKQG